VPGKTHTAADALSRPTGSDEGKDDNQRITMLPQATFIQIADANSDNSLENMIMDCQSQYSTTMKEWQDVYPIESIEMSSQQFWKDTNQQRLVIPPNDSLK